MHSVQGTTLTVPRISPNRASSVANHASRLATVSGYLYTEEGCVSLIASMRRSTGHSCMRRSTGHSCMRRCACIQQSVTASPDKVNSSCCPLRPRTTPFPEENSILGVLYGVLLWVDMNAATPLGAWGRSVISLAGLRCIPRSLTKHIIPYHSLRLRMEVRTRPRDSCQHVSAM